MSHRVPSLRSLAVSLSLIGVAGCSPAGEGSAQGASSVEPGNAEQLTDVHSELREFVVGPEYTDAREMTLQDEVPEGTIHRFTMSSEDSELYPGVSGPYERQVGVYVPAGYTPGTEAPLMIVQDGVRSYLERTTPVLDNLIHEGRIPPMVAVFVDPGPGDGPGSQRGYEYDHVTHRYVNFIETEVLPRVEADYDVTITSDPEGRSSFGGSSGAAAALTMAWFRPDLYRKVLSYSGTFVNMQRRPHSATPYGAWEYHETLIPQADPKPIRIWFHVSDGDNGADRPEESRTNWVLGNQRMLEVLKDKGYDYRYVFSTESTHVDRNVVAQTLPAALEWLWRDYPIEGSTGGD